MHRLRRPLMTRDVDGLERGVIHADHGVRLPGIRILGRLWACALPVEWTGQHAIARLQSRVKPPWFQPLVNVFLAGRSLRFMQVSASLGAIRAAARVAKALAMPLTGSLASFLYARLHIDQLASWGWCTLAATGSIGLA